MPSSLDHRPGNAARHGGARGRWPAAVAVLGAAAVAICTLAPSAAQTRTAAQSGAPAVEPDKVGVFMRAKLGHAQKVLEGLTIEDYDLIEKGAHDLALASQASSWQVLQTEDYARHSDDFRRSCNSLRAAAKARNLDGAALAWMEVTMKCIQCHKYVRDTRREP